MWQVWSSRWEVLVCRKKGVEGGPLYPPPTFPFSTLRGLAHMCVDSAPRSKLCPHPPLAHLEDILVHMQGSQNALGVALSHLGRECLGSWYQHLLRKVQALGGHISLGLLTLWGGEWPEEGGSRPFKARDPDWDSSFSSLRAILLSCRSFPRRPISSPCSSHLQGLLKQVPNVGFPQLLNLIRPNSIGKKEGEGRTERV